jgi:hypothetical protein
VGSETLLRIVAAVAGAWAVVVLLAWAFQRRLIYQPLGSSVPPVEEVLEGAEAIALETSDGIALGAWYLPARGEKDERAAVLVFNGNAGNRADRAGLAEAFSREGFSVLLFDYRGYGGNAGRPDEPGLLEDARAARRWLERRVDPERIVYFGESLGTAVAIALAAEAPPAALVLRSPFPSLVEVARRHYPFLPVRPLLRDRFECLDRVRRARSPVLVIAGERDRIVPPSLSRKLFEAAGEPKRLWILPGADHNDPSLVGGERLVSEAARFAREALSSPARPEEGPL